MTANLKKKKIFKKINEMMRKFNKILDTSPHSKTYCKRQGLH